MKLRSLSFLTFLGVLLGSLLLPSCGKKEGRPAGGAGGAGPAQAAPGGGKTKETAPSPGPSSKTGKSGLSPQVLEGLPQALVEALKMAHREKRLVLVEVFDRECNFCQDMEQVLAEPLVQEAMKSFLYVKVGKDATKLIEEFALTRTPTFLVYKPDGTPLDVCIEGFRSGKVFSAELENALRMYQGKPLLDVPEDDHPNYGKG